MSPSPCLYCNPFHRNIFLYSKTQFHCATLSANRSIPLTDSSQGFASPHPSTPSFYHILRPLDHHVVPRHSPHSPAFPLNQMSAVVRLPNASRILFLFILVTYFQSISALRFYLQDRERRCFKFDAPFSSRVIGERSVANGPGTAELSIEIKATNGKIVYESHTSDPNDSKFGFVTPHFTTSMVDGFDFDDYEYGDYDDDGTYHVCLTLTLDAAIHKTGKRAVTFWIRPEASANGKPSEKHATEDAIASVTGSLQTMHNILQQMISDLSALQQRERRLVKRSNNTAKRLTLFSILALVILVFTAACQFLFFKKFFKSKKLL